MYDTEHRLLGPDCVSRYVIILTVYRTNINAYNNVPRIVQSATHKQAQVIAGGSETCPSLNILGSSKGNRQGFIYTLVWEGVLEKTDFCTESGTLLQTDKWPGCFMIFEKFVNLCLPPIIIKKIIRL